MAAQQKPALPEKKYRFRKAADVIQARVKALNNSHPDIGKVSFADLKVDINNTAKTFTISLKDSGNNLYLNPQAEIEFSYTHRTLEQILTTAGFKTSYWLTDKDAVIEKLPQGLTTQWEETQKRLTVTVDDSASGTFNFADDNATLACKLLPATETFVITFTEDPVDIETILANRTVAFDNDLNDYLEEVVE